MPEEERPRWPGRLPGPPAPVGPSSGEGERGPVLLGRYALTRRVLATLDVTGGWPGTTRMQAVETCGHRVAPRDPACWESFC